MHVPKARRSSRRHDSCWNLIRHGG
jgi:hypothetical protein